MSMLGGGTVGKGIVGEGTVGKGTVTFIGGTAYSGSTLLSLVIANDPLGFSCGEVHAFVNPYLPHHLTPRCGCGNPSCDVWRTFKASGYTSPHRWVFDHFPGTRVLVDSSKDVGWIRPSAVALQRDGYAVRHLLVWKSPEEYLQSRMKRKQLKGWASSWINYHRAYLTVFEHCRTVRYESLVADPATLDGICSFLGIDNFHGKTDYWNKTHHSLFGNSSARIHLAAKDSHEYARMQSELDRQAATGGNAGHQSLIYSAPSTPELATYASTRELDAFERLRAELESRDVRKNGLAGAAPFHWPLIAPWYVYNRVGRLARVAAFKARTMTG